MANSDDSIRLQSKAAYKQWAEQWREQAAAHLPYKKKPLRDFENVGIGKAVVCVANGYSFEENIDILREHQNNVDILCCDKTLGHLLDNGIVPTYCMVCDANVNYEKYLKPYEHLLKDTILFINVCANPQWSANGNWKDKYFFVNQDIIDSHIEFSKLSGCTNFMPAGTNVSNAMVILLSQSDNTARRNLFGYDKMILVGYDYSWKDGGKYYAFDEDGGGKANYMKHSYITLPSGAFAYTSGNLIFSKNWLAKYIANFNLPVVQTSKDSLLSFGKVSDLAEQMQYRHKVEDRKSVKKMVDELREIEKRSAELRGHIHTIGKDHWWAHARTV
jgi:hypothetical protein